MPSFDVGGGLVWPGPADVIDFFGTVLEVVVPVSRFVQWGVVNEDPGCADVVHVVSVDLEVEDRLRSGPRYDSENPDRALEAPQLLTCRERSGRHEVLPIL
jgi:hypothetical protein